jgi:hypothetical protein
MLKAQGLHHLDKKPSMAYIQNHYSVTQSAFVSAPKEKRFTAGVHFAGMEISAPKCSSKSL